jgi:hypothetical protein
VFCRPPARFIRSNQRILYSSARPVAQRTRAAGPRAAIAPRPRRRALLSRRLASPRAATPPRRTSLPRTALPEIPCLSLRRMRWTSRSTACRRASPSRSSAAAAAAAAAARPRRARPARPPPPRRRTACSRLTSRTSRAARAGTASFPRARWRRSLRRRGPSSDSGPCATCSSAHSARAPKPSRSTS